MMINLKIHNKRTKIELDTSLYSLFLKEVLNQKSIGRIIDEQEHIKQKKEVQDYIQFAIDNPPKETFAKRLLFIHKTKKMTVEFYLWEETEKALRIKDKEMEQLKKKMKELEDRNQILSKELNHQIMKNDGKR